MTEENTTIDVEEIKKLATEEGNKASDKTDANDKPGVMSPLLKKITGIPEIDDLVEGVRDDDYRSINYYNDRIPYLYLQYDYKQEIMSYMLNLYATGKGISINDIPRKKIKWDV